jgi:hypothetical protein
MKRVVFRLVISAVACFGTVAKPSQISTGFSLYVSPDGERFSSVQLGETLRADAHGFDVKMAAADVNRFLAKQEKPVLISKWPDFYLERRGFKNPVLQVHTYTASAANSVKLVGLSPNVDIETKIVIPEFIEGVTFAVEGTADVYKCFTPDSCVFKESVANQWIFWPAAGSHKIQIYDSIGQTNNGSMMLEARISNRQNQQIKISDPIAAKELGYAELNGFGQAPNPETGFVGFASSIALNALGNTYITGHVFPESNGIKVRIITEAHFNCTYTRLTSVSESTTVTMPLGSQCPSLYEEGSWIFSGAGPGNDHETVKEWFFADFTSVLK